MGKQHAAGSLTPRFSIGKVYAQSPMSAVLILDAKSTVLQTASESFGVKHTHSEGNVSYISSYPTHTHTHAPPTALLLLSAETTDPLRFSEHSELPFQQAGPAPGYGGGDQGDKRPLTSLRLHCSLTRTLQSCHPRPLVSVTREDNNKNKG